MKSKELFENAVIEEVRPTRKLRILHLPNAESQVTLFFVHDACATMEQFSEAICLLKEKYSIVAYDAFGCGKSERSNEYEAYSTAAHSADLLAIFNKYASFVNIAVGHAYGSSLVMKLATVFTGHNVEGMVLISSALHIQPGYSRIYSLPLSVLSLIKGVISSVFCFRAYNYFTSSAAKKKAILTASLTPTHVLKATYQQMRWAKIEYLSNIIIPTLIIHGKRDTIMPLSGAAALSEKLVRSSVVVVPNAAYQVMEDQPYVVTEHISEFVSKVCESLRIDKTDCRKAKAIKACCGKKSMLGIGTGCG
mmetsp:Transcript_32712/g.41828  ORF Transcript_32712/g.41828 Transcript_32712/m.41828 type:complete len:307 (-) Transcript_32712:183-1103(-)|eukprot:CAMPEP_0117888674 /NCGR_PEP_ID=MMETSP0950-20121206/22046_1 /TAXON_ID=44440 /ORGANISM="Chattonella subsalsa, Strain CCMP2191" /LENGTH=306 /DNA_ID=CAMNT_0005747137 /DNA_START=39 /DNA_END=959 /DNA_ORIENTATION=-